MSTEAVEVLLIRMSNCDKIASDFQGRSYYAPQDLLVYVVS